MSKHKSADDKLHVSKVVQKYHPVAAKQPPSAPAKGSNSNNQYR